ncbi:MAG: hypothetical protein GY749_02885 [Desulfobacteraceae bacterium]|nr:hypothetical protein [Desulfobacteraceae bacterium]
MVYEFPEKMVVSDGSKFRQTLLATVNRHRSREESIAFSLVNIRVANAEFYKVFQELMFEIIQSNNIFVRIIFPGSGRTSQTDELYAWMSDKIELSETRSICVKKADN